MLKLKLIPGISVTVALTLLCAGECAEGAVSKVVSEAAVL